MEVLATIPLTWKDKEYRDGQALTHITVCYLNVLYLSGCKKYRKSPKNSNTQTNCCNYPKI